MQVEQGIFTSVDSSSMKGYQLVSRSSRIDKHIAQELCRWAPSHASLLCNDSEYSSLNYFPILGRWAAVARTVYGGPEYSGRGSMQIVTNFLVLRNEQFAQYDNDPLAVSRTALALGLLRLSLEMPDQLPKVDLPEKPFASCSRKPKYQSESSSGIDEESICREILQLLREGRRVAAMGITEPLPICERVINQTAKHERLELSIATGLIPSTHRQYRLHFIPGRDATFERRLQAQGITCVTVA